MAGLLAVKPSIAARASGTATVFVKRECSDTVKIRLAVNELRSGLVALGLAGEVLETADPRERHGARVIILQLDPRGLAGEDYEIASTADALVLRAGQEQALLYAVFDLLERQGMTFGVDGGVVPIDLPERWALPPRGAAWRGQPTLCTRGLLPWPDFLNCVSVYNQEDFRAYFAAMLRMRLNTFGMHVYTDNEQPTESYLSFNFAGTGHQAALETSAMRGWGYLPQRTSTYKMGSAPFFDRETFGSDAARLAADNWEIADRTAALLRDGLSFARELGIRTGVGFEPYKLPAAIAAALPPEARNHPQGFGESPTAKALLESRLADLLERYPSVDHVWLWEDETSNWESRAKNVPISATAFLHAYAFLRRHTPEKRLVVAGWGGFTRHFDHLHQALPEDVIFAALGNTLGWDPVSEAFGALGARERWPIPWLEDDPSMWFPQFRAARVQEDMERARGFGCQGMLGIHWRHRIVDPTATYFARAAWDGSLTAKAHYARYAGSQASKARAAELAALFVDCDEGHAIVSTYTGTREPGGFAGHVELSADYQEGFKYRENQPDPARLETQRRTAARFTALAQSAALAKSGSSAHSAALAQSAAASEHERLAYLAGQVGFMVPYCDAYRNAHALDGVLSVAVELRNAGDGGKARDLVLREGIPLWTALAPQVRGAILTFQHVIATRNDLGQLASMQNKLVRIALERLRLSLREFVGDLPPQVQTVYASVIAPDDSAPPRIFLPTRPSVLRPSESLRLFAVTAGLGGDSPAPVLRTRRLGELDWSSAPARHEGRNVFSVVLGPVGTGAGSIEYRLECAGPAGLLSDPPGYGVHRATVLS
jgi:hypothetical protein